MSDFETLLQAWLNGGTIPADFVPSSNVEAYLLAIINGVDDDIDPKSRADVLLDAIATKYAGYATGITDLRAALGLDTRPEFDDATTPALIALAQDLINGFALGDLAEKGATGVSRNTLAILDAYSNLPSGGAELNIAYGNTAPEDTTKLWVKADTPPSVTMDYNPDNTVESIHAVQTFLPRSASGIACGVVGTKCYLFGGFGSNYLNTINVFDTETNTITTLSATLPTASMYSACGVVGTKCYLFGGQYSGSDYLNTINVFDTETNTITTLSTTLPLAEYDLACGVIGTKCYLFGGSAHRKEIKVFDTETNTITVLSAKLPADKYSSACGVIGTKCYLFGGRSGTSSYQNTIYVFDTETNTVSTLQTTLPTIAGYVACGVIGTKCYLFGGASTTLYLNTINVFDSETNTITTLQTTLPVAEARIACGVVGTDCYLFGGMVSAGGDAINKFTVTFPLAEGAVFIYEDMLKNKFTLIKSPTEITVGVAAVSKGNASGYAENCEAYLHDGTQWRQI